MAVLWIEADSLDSPDDPNAQLAAEAASYILYRLTGEKYPGVLGPVTEWYGRRGSSCWSCFGNLGETELALAPHGHRYFEGSVQGLRLRGNPIVSVSSVTTAAGALPSADYQVANRSVLYRTNRTPWNFDSGVTVTYIYGQNPPPLGRLAAIKLGNELVLSVTDPDACSLPANVTNVTRLGLSFALSNTAALAALRQTGIFEVDLFVAVSNPSGALKRPRIFSPDKPRGESYL